ncbi:MAG: DUF5050 domain-containing protein [Colwellia sp.]|nr:DUF5050 domain-containing protein [Colwellia sp.]
MYNTNFRYCFSFLFTVILLSTISCTNKLYTSPSAKENHTPQLNNIDRKLLFVSNQDGDREVFLTNLKGENLKQLTHNNRDDYDASWSPDGQFILFTSNRDGGNSEVYVMAVDGSQQRNLSRSPSYDGQARWSPDGKFIVFNSDRNGSIGLYIMSFDGKNIKQVSKDDMDGYVFPSWSPNGEWISYSKQDFNGKSNVWIVKADGSEHQQLTNNRKSEEGQVHWSPDSQKLLYHSRRNREYNIYLFDLKSTKEQQLTYLRSADSRPQWSNKGDQIVFLSTRGPVGRTQLFIMKEDGSQLKSLSDGRFQVDDATWLLDDSGLLFVSWQQGRVSNVYSVDVKTGEQIAISPAKGYQSQPLPEPAALPKFLSLSRTAIKR